MTVRTDCRCCRSNHLTEVFSLGEQPYANAYMTAEQLGQPEPTSPLILMECADCGQVQLKHVVDASELYQNYSYLTSSSKRMVAHFAKLMADAVGTYCREGALVVEIGSNDGTALASIRAPDVRKLGVDPAENLATIANASGVQTIAAFFSERLALNVVQQFGDASLIVACNVLAHIDDLDDLCRGVKRLLSLNGAFIVEVPDVSDLISKTEFDSIYQEHLSYFSLRSLVHLFARHGLCVASVEKQHVHCGSMRLTVRHRLNINTDSVVDWMMHDKKPRDWPAFKRRCQLQRHDLLQWLHHDNHQVWGYCASAKATVLLNYCGIGTDLLPVVVDSTPQKIGHFMPGTHQPILDTSELRTQHPDAALILAGNHLAEIREKEAAYINSGGRLICPTNLD